MPKEGGEPGLQFFPVLHLMTGPPGLTRNGGIWKRLKSGLRDVSKPPRIMVQALHFVPYNLSPRAWEDWFPPNRDYNRLANELERAYGPRRDVFVDSGGFQLLHSENIDLSRWGYDLSAESIYRLQSKYSASRAASLDSPIPPSADPSTVGRLSEVSISNAVWLANNFSTATNPPKPYLVVHGRSPDELRVYLRRLEASLPAGWLNREKYGIALGSQVPLAGDPELVLSNAVSVLRWMNRSTPPGTPFHMFGAGDGLMGLVIRSEDRHSRPISYDNSTYVQKAFRLKIFDPVTKSYIDVDPGAMPECTCTPCGELRALGASGVTTLLSSPAYGAHELGGARWNKSDVLALIALHNLRWWKTRLAVEPRHYRVNRALHRPGSETRQGMGYRFPLPKFEPLSRRLLIVPCSKWRPYCQSPSHTKVRAYLEAHELREKTNYDRITLSGVHGPVHWTDEDHPAIMGYDFPLTRAVSESHVQRLLVRTGAVLGVVTPKYDRTVAYLRSREYARVFGALLSSFAVAVTSDIAELPALLGAAK